MLQQNGRGPCIAAAGSPVERGERIREAGFPRLREPFQHINQFRVFLEQRVEVLGFIEPSEQVDGRDHRGAARRVLAGIEPHAALPRGTEALGFYKDEGSRVKITQVRLASQIAGFPRWQMMDTASPSFAAVVQARANRTGFFIRPAGAADLCTLRVPVREVAQSEVK